MIAGVTQAISRYNEIFRYLVANHPVPIWDIRAITDVGKLTRTVCRLVNPKEFNVRFRKVPVPPFGIF
jgi:hypothetical protein